MSLELIKTTMEDILENIVGDDEHPLYVCVDDWFSTRYEEVEHEACCEVLDKMIVSYITGKARILQRWFRSFEELPMACPCDEASEDMCCGCGKYKETGPSCDCGGGHRANCDECAKKQ